MLLDRQTDRVTRAPRRDGWERMAGLRNAARNLAAALAGLHPSDGASQDIARPRCARMGRGCENGKAFRPIAELAHRDIDLQRIDRALDQGLEWPQRAPAVEAEQGADVLGAAAVRGLLAGENRGGRARAGGLAAARIAATVASSVAQASRSSASSRALLRPMSRRSSGSCPRPCSSMRGNVLVQPYGMNALPMTTGAPPPCARAHRVDRLADIAQRPQVLDEGKRPCRRQHVGAAAHQEAAAVPSRGISASAASSLGVKLVR